MSKSAELPRVFAGKGRTYLLRLVANGLAQALCTLATAFLVQYAFDNLITPATGAYERPLFYLGLGFAGSAAGLAWLRMAEQVDAERLGQDYIHRTRTQAYRHLTALVPRALQRRSRGALMLRFVTDLSALRRWVSLGLARLAAAGLTTVLTLGALAVVNWVLALSVLVVLLLGTLAVALQGGALQRTVREARRRRSRLAADLSDRIASMAVVQAFGQARRERRRVTKQSQNLKVAMVQQAKAVGRVRAAAEGAVAASSAVVVIVGTLEVAQGRATPGTVVAALSIIGLLVPALRDLGRVFEYYRSAQISKEKLRDFLATPTLVHERRNAPDLEAGPGRLTFEQVSLGSTLNVVTATAEAGQVVAVAGSNGAGKSTLFELAARFIDPDEGRVLLDGQDLRRCNLSSLRRAVSMVSADLPLLRGTVTRNLRYRAPHASEEEVAEVWQLCRLGDVVNELPEGGDTRIRDGGSNLSAGQRQRLALARALLGGSRLLLLDEADANLDPEATKILDEVIRKLRGQVTILFITHRPARLALADIVWRLEAGKLIQVAPPEELALAS